LTLTSKKRLLQGYRNDLLKGFLCDLNENIAKDDPSFAIDKEMAKKEFKNFPPYVAKEYWKRGKHLDLLCQKLQDVADGKTKRLMVFMPPRHGKSQTTSIFFPAWFLGNYPDKRVILSAYGADLALDFSKKSRDVLREYGDEIFGLRLSKRSQAGKAWDIDNYRGGMVAAGVGGAITGKGANVFIIDDPIKNQKEANSEVYRRELIEWYRSVAYTRLAPNGAIIICLTRWHKYDLAGSLIKQQLEEDGEVWDVINLPAIACDEDILGRERGKALWPEMFDENTLEIIKKAIGSYWFASLYQQDPTEEEGTLFRRGWFKYFRETWIAGEQYYVLMDASGAERIVSKSKCEVFQMVDPAATEKEKSDYFCIGTFANTPDMELLVLDIYREKLETTKHLDILKKKYQEFKPSFIGVEEKTFGLSIIQAGKKTLPIKGVKADRDKVSRARTVAIGYENGNNYHRLGAPWIDAFEKELIEFPFGQHDDQADVLAYAGAKMVFSGMSMKKMEVVGKSLDWNKMFG